ncbi:MAG: sugar phosphate isomerase/epimerase [Gemmatimonadetes bacterium]|nr:sugar phosphate isomerase/epimerase [Gemmatimonadota bacterium]
MQLYTLRQAMARDVEATLAQVAVIGFTQVEFAGYFGKTPAQMRAILDRHGLAAPSAHIPIEMLSRNWATVLEEAHDLGHRYLCVAWIPAEMRRTVDDYKRVAELFSRAGEESHAHGIRFAYHNHDFELAPLEGRVPLDVLLEETDPAHVWFELDLYWITKGGGDPLAYFNRYPNRFPLVHVKDSAGPPDHRMVDVGQGTIDWKRIFARRDQAGIRHYFVEHDEPQDPFASIRASYQYLRRLRF